MEKEAARTVVHAVLWSFAAGILVGSYMTKADRDRADLKRERAAREKAEARAQGREDAGAKAA